MKKFLALFLASAISVMAAPTQPSTPILNGKLLNNLNANGFRIDALDTSNLNLGGGGGGTPLTDLTLNTPIVLFSSAAVNFTIVGGSVAGTMTLHTQQAGTIFSNLSGAIATPVWNDLPTFKAAAAINNLDNTSDVNKPISTAMQVALDLKETISSHNTDVTSINSAIALKANTADVNAALSLKADVSGLTAAFNAKQDVLPTTSNDGWILARHSTGPQAFFFVDPVSLGGGGGGGGGSGTVTNFSIVNNTAPLFTASVSNSTVTPQLTLTTTTTTSANTFYGNPTNFAGAAQFMGPAGARGILTAGNAVGQNLLTLADPSAIRYIKINADNSVTLDTSAQFLGDIGGEAALGNPSSNGQVLSSTTAGVRSFVSKENPLSFATPLGRIGDVISMPAAGVAANGYLTIGDWTAFNAKESALTFAAPITRSGNSISLPTASTSVSGYLLSTDWTTFNNKAPSTRTISTTAPITGGGDLSVNRTFAMAPAGSSADGYLTSANWTLFNSKASGDSEVILTNTGGTTGSPATWTTGASTAKETVALTAPKFILLPPANAYQAGRRIYYFDSVTTGNFGRSFRRQGSDTLNGDVLDVQPFIAGTTGYNGSKTATFETDGTSAWRILSSGTVDHVENPSDATQSFGFDATLQTPNVRGIVTAAGGNSVTIAPTDSGIPGLVRDITAGGVAVKAPLNPTEIVPQQELIGVAGSNITETTHTVDNSGIKDTVRIDGAVTAPLTIKWPSAGNYSPSEPMALVDFSGTVSPLHPITITSINGIDTFGGQSSFVFDEPNGGRRVLTSDGTGNWAVASAKTSIQPFKVITPTSGNTFTVVPDASAVKQNAHMTLVNGQNILSIPGPADGMPFELVLVQPASGAQGTLSLPVGSQVGANGVGVVALSSANGAVDRLRGSYDGTIGAFLWDAPIVNHTSAAVPSAPSGLATGGVTASKVDLSWTDNSSNETGFAVERAPGTSGTAFTEITRTNANAVAYSDGGVAPSSPYNYRVRAFNSGGYSSYSSSASATTSAGGATADLWEVHFNEGGTATTAAATVGPNATLTYPDWTASTQSSAAAFNPSSGMGTAGPVSLSTVGTVGTTSYSYRVGAFKNVSGNHSTSSGPITIATGNATLTSANYIHITWSAVTGADYYEVYRTTVGAGGSPSTVGRLTGTGSGFNLLVFDDTGVATNGAIPSGIASSTDGHTATANTNITPTSQLLTFSFWAKAAYSGSGTNNIFNPVSNVFLRHQSGSKFQITFNGGNGLPLTGTVSNSVTSNGSAVNSGTTWHLIVVELDNSTTGNTTTNGATDNIRVYFDGNHQQTVTYTTTTRANAATFGAAQPQIGGALFVGAIDDVRIYGRHLTTTEIDNLFTGNAQ